MLELHNISPITTNDNDIVTVCPLWHMKQNGKSDCVNNVIGNIKCNKGSLTVEESHCITWDNDTESIRITRCLFAPINSEVCSNGSCYSLSAKYQIQNWTSRCVACSIDKEHNANNVLVDMDMLHFLMVFPVLTVQSIGACGSLICCSSSYFWHFCSWLSPYYKLKELPVLWISSLPTVSW